MNWMILLTLQVTIIAAVAISIAPMLRRSTTRHSVLLAALIVIATAPCAMLIPQSAVPVSMPAFMVLPATSHAQAASVASIATTPRFPTTGLLLTVWTTGAVFMLSRLIVAWIQVRRFQTTASHRWRRVRISSNLATPICVGVVNPVVLLPASLLTDLSPHARRQVLAHELAHLRNRDHLVLLLQQLVLAAWWFHPLVHVLARQLARAREERCDDEVVRVTDRFAYARTLLSLAVATPRPMPLLALFDSRHRLKLRIHRIVNQRRPAAMPTCKPFIASLAAFTLVVTVLASCTTKHTPKPSAMTDEQKRQALTPDNARPLHPIQFTLGEGEFAAGDSITIDSVKCTSDSLSQGETFEVSGHYTLVSHDSAMLALFITSSGWGSTPVHEQQRTNITKGSGTFTLKHKFVTGYPHVSFYGGGSAFGGVYFGQGDSVLAHKDWSYKQPDGNGLTVKSSPDRVQ